MDPLMAKVLAVASATEQASFFNEVGRTLRRVIHAHEGADYDLQVCRVVDGLDGDGRALVKRLASFIESDEKAVR